MFDLKRYKDIAKKSKKSEESQSEDEIYEGGRIGGLTDAGGCVVMCCFLSAFLFIVILYPVLYVRYKDRFNTEEGECWEYSQYFKENKPELYDLIQTFITYYLVFIIAIPVQIFVLCCAAANTSTKCTEYLGECIVLPADFVIIIYHVVIGFKAKSWLPWLED